MMEWTAGLSWVAMVNHEGKSILQTKLSIHVCQYLSAAPLKFPIDLLARICASGAQNMGGEPFWTLKTLTRYREEEDPQEKR